MIIENIQLAFASLRSNKMRALLTMLGIIIGIMSIITIVIIGDAMSASVSGSLSSLGASNITVSVQERGATQDGAVSAMRERNGAARASGGRVPASDDLLSDGQIADMKALFGDAITGVSLSHSGGAAQARDAERYANLSLNGVNGDYFTANSVTLLDGRLLSDADVEQLTRVAVVSDHLAGKLFPAGENAVGRQVRVYKPDSVELYTVVGLYQYEPMGFMGSTVADEDVSTSFYIPVSVAKQDILEKNYTNLTVIGSADADVEQLTRALQTYFDGVYTGNDTWRVNVSNMTSMLDAVTEALSTMSVAIAFIAGISLIVGGIGVMNIMLVSVTERTREIGTRKALGAKHAHIRVQFVTEALIIALVGGVIGLALGVAAGGGAAAFFGAPLVISPVVVTGSVLFSMAIGVFFGLYPANKAAKLDPIDALRYE